MSRSRNVTVVDALSGKPLGVLPRTQFKRLAAKAIAKAREHGCEIAPQGLERDIKYAAGSMDKVLAKGWVRSGCNCLIGEVRQRKGKYPEPDIQLTPDPRQEAELAIGLEFDDLLTEYLDATNQI